MIDARRKKGLSCGFKTGEDVYEWWMESDDIKGQMNIFDFIEEGETI